jgi:hypothetical protein
MFEYLIFKSITIVMYVWVINFLKYQNSEQIVTAYTTVLLLYFKIAINKVLLLKYI